MFGQKLPFVMDDNAIQTSLIVLKLLENQNTTVKLINPYLDQVANNNGRTEESVFKEQI